MAHALERRRPHLKAAPEADPRFRKVMESLKHGAAHAKKHAPAAKKAHEASAAAKGPPNEKAAGAKSKQVDKLEEAPANKPETTSFLDMMRAEIQSAMPQKLGDTDDFMKDGKPAEMKGSLKGSVSQATGKAAGDIKGASEGKPNEAGVPVKDVTAIPGEAAPIPPSVQGAQAMPLPKSEKEVSLQDSKQDTEDEMKDAHVTPPQLRKANDPRFSAVLTTKDAVARQADTAPAQYRVSEKGVLASAASQAQARGKAGALAIVGVRGRSNSAVLTKQAAAQAKEEKERKDVTDRIEAIYIGTKVIVDLKLATLEAEVGTMFDTGIDDAIQTMSSYVDARLDAYKDERYSGWTGGLKWGKDKLFGLPHAVDVFYKEGRRVFEQTMDALVVRVAARVELRLKEAKNEVAKGQAAIATFVAGLKPSLQKVGKKAEKEMTDKFQELEQGIDDKKSQLAQSLAQKYKEGFDKADEALKKIQDANKGLVTAFVEKLGEIIEILRNFKDKLLALLRKAASVIGLIVDDPIGFLKNMIAAIKQGFGQFVNNIWKHIKNGFMKWLFGNLADSGIELPADFSLPSILKLVLGVLGITYERMLAKAVKTIGGRAVKLIAKVAGYVKELITGGPAALWEKVKDDLSNLKEMVIDTIQNWLIETVVKRAIAKVVLLFNPVGAIIQAIMAIYDLVTFLIDKATQIMAVIESVIDSVAAIVAGDIGGAANRIEQSLADTIPLVIGFLASFIGLGGISKTVKGMIEKVQHAVDKAIDKALARVIGFVRNLMGGGKGEPAEKDDPAKETKVNAGLDYLHEQVKEKQKQEALLEEDAQGIAQKVKQRHPVFTVIRPVQQGGEINFYYEASPGKYVAGAHAAGTVIMSVGNVTMKSVTVNPHSKAGLTLKNLREGNRGLKGKAFEMNVKTDLLSSGGPASPTVTRDFGGRLGTAIQSDVASQFPHIQSSSLVLEPKEVVRSVKGRPTVGQKAEHAQASANALTQSGHLTMFSEFELNSEAEGTSRRPDALGKIVSPQSGKVEGLVVAEITLQRDIRKPMISDRNEKKLHKPQQLLFTLTHIKEAYGLDIAVQYHIITPAITDPRLRDDLANFLNDMVASTKMTNVHFIWHMLS